MKLTKIVLAFILVLSTVLSVSISSADGDMYFDETTKAFMFNEPHYGIVICTQMNVRADASTRSKSYGKIKNSMPVKILGITDRAEFYVLDLQSCGITNQDPGSYGYVKANLVKIDPWFVYLQKLTYLYATPWNADIGMPEITADMSTWIVQPPTKLKNGEQDGRSFLIIGQQNNWYAVQSAESAPGTAFIRSKDIPTDDLNYMNTYVITWEAPLLSKESKAQIKTIDRFTLGELKSIEGDYALMTFFQGTENEITGYIDRLYIAPLLNGLQLEEGVG